MADDTRSHYNDLRASIEANIAWRRGGCFHMTVGVLGNGGSTRKYVAELRAVTLDRTWVGNAGNLM